MFAAHPRATCRQLRHFVVLEDGSDEPFRRRRSTTRTRSRLGVTRARDFEPRSADDLYILYTGGTTGMPKGVMWRAEDIFFAALGGGGFGQTADREAGGARRARSRAEDARTINLVNAPMMHGGGQWASFINFFGGGTVVLNTMHRFDPDAVWRTIARERCNSIMVVGDAMARPLAEALAGTGRDATTRRRWSSSARAARSCRPR